MNDKGLGMFVFYLLEFKLNISYNLHLSKTVYIKILFYFLSSITKYY